MKFYAGVGSRETPREICEIMHAIASRLETQGWILRSGGARGADLAFQGGVVNPARREIFLPGPSFNTLRPAPNNGIFNYRFLPGYQDALRTVKQFHPAPQRLSEFGRHAMARNAMQVLGPDLRTPSKFVVAWAPVVDGQPQGGTAQAIRIADHHGIHVRNLFVPSDLDKVRTWLAR